MEIPIYRITISEKDETGVNFVAFVENPAIESDFVALNKPVLLAKDNMKQVLTGAVLIPDKQIYRADKENNPYYIVYDADTIEKASQKFFKQNKTHNTNDEHLIALDKNYVVESWIVADPKNDKSNSLGFDVPIGTWMMSYKIEDKEYWNNEILSGNKKGFSIEGFFGLEKLSQHKTNDIKDKKEKMGKKTVLQKLKALLTAVKLADYELEDGRTLTVDDDTNECFIEGQPAEDGEYVTVDGETITVSQGIVDADNSDIEVDQSLIIPAVDAVPISPEAAIVEQNPKTTSETEAMSGEIQLLKSELAEVKLKLAEKEAEIIELNKKPATQSVTKEVELKTITNTPISLGGQIVQNLRKINKELGRD